MLLPVIALFNKKISWFVKGRKETFVKLTKLKDKKTIWFHASSLGEFEQAIPIIEKLKEHFKNQKILVTFFSPSGYNVRKNYPLADVVCYLPLDSSKNAKKFINTINITVAIFIKYEFWPNFLFHLKQKQIPTILVSGIFREKQIFFKSYGSFMRKALNSFDHFFVQDYKSKKLLNSINIKNITIAGDTRFDRVSKIVNQNNSLNFIESFVDKKFILVSGSTWKEDEQIIVNYINTKASDNEKFVFAPHNIKHLGIDKLKQSIQKKTILFSEIPFNKNKQEYADFDTVLKDCQVLIIDAIGFLTKIYSYASVAYVGGGLKTGLHNILEPATFGIPIIIGNNFEKFKEARDLVDLKGCFTIKNKNEFNSIFNHLKTNPVLREKASNINFDYVKENTGCTKKIIEYLNKFI